MKICSKCNLEYDDKFVFCKRCGCKLELLETKKLSHNEKKVEKKVATKPKVKSSVSNKINMNKVIAGVIVLIALLGFFVINDNSLFDKELPQAEADGTIALAPAMYNGKWGLLDKKGNWFIKPSYLSVGKFSEGLLGVLDFDSKKYGFIDKNGKWVIKPQFYVSDEQLAEAGKVSTDKFASWTNENFRYQPMNIGAPAFKEGYAAVRFGKHNCGFIDKNGRVLCSNYLSVGSFNDGFAIVKIGDKNYGYIDKNGKLLCSGFEDVYPFKDGFAKVIVKKGKNLQNNISAVIDKKGQYVIKPTECYIKGFTEGYYLLHMPLGMGYWKPYDSYISSPIYAQAEEFSEGLAFVWTDTYAPCFIDKNFNVVFYLSEVDGLAGVFRNSDDKLRFGYDMSFKNGRLPIEICKDACGLVGDVVKTITVDRKGNVISYAPKDEYANVGNGEIVPKDANFEKYGYVNNKGEYVIQPQFKLAYEFKNGVAIVEGQGDYPNETFGLIDMQGNFIKEISRDILYSTYCGLIISGKDGKFGALDSTGKNVVIPYKFEAFYTFDKTKPEDLLLTYEMIGK